jgi:DNA invertase Pin-like site-specific DNA recombinase
VSTDREEQANSFESQQCYFRAWIERNPEWELVSVFADEGISGTGTKKRMEFNRMIEAAKAGKIDLILTKEVSRFARNTVDTLQFTRELRKMGVYVLFLNDNIHTNDPSAELRLAIMASVAQEESRKTSERVKWGQKRRMEQGVVFGRDLLGYRVKDGKLTVHEHEAEIVRLIFSMFLNEGKGAYVIAGELTAAKVPTAPHMKDWSGVNILRILKNEKYCGDLVQKKTYTPDYLSHEKKYNRGEEELVVIRDHHEAIVSREMFMRVQEELMRRATLRQKKVRHSGAYSLSGKVICGECGSIMVARSKPRKDGSRYLAWRCPKAMRSQPQCGQRRQIGNQILMEQIGSDQTEVEEIEVFNGKCVEIRRKG